MEKRLKKYQLYVYQGKEPIKVIRDGYQETFSPKHFDKILYYAKCLIALGRFEEAQDFIYPILSSPFQRLNKEQSKNESDLILASFRMEYELVVRSLANNHPEKQLQTELENAIFSIKRLEKLETPELKNLIYHEILLETLKGEHVFDYCDEPRYKSFAKQITEYDYQITLDHIFNRNFRMFQKNQSLGNFPNPKKLKAHFVPTIDLETLFEEVSEKVSLIPRNELIDPIVDKSLIAYDAYEFDLASCGICQGGVTDHLRAQVAPGTNNVCDLYPIPYIKQARSEAYSKQYTLTSQRR